MNGKHLAKIEKRLGRVTGWLDAAGHRRAASVPSTPGGMREQRGRELGRLLADMPDLIAAVRTANHRGQSLASQRCRFCGLPLKRVRGVREGLYAVEIRDGGVLCEDPRCPDSPDGKHAEPEERDDAEG